MKVRVWVVATTVPERGEGPCMPFVFGSEAQAEAHADKMLRDEWQSAEIPDGEAADAMPYPNDWREAQRRLIKFYGDGSWGTWEITVHDVEIDGLAWAASPIGAVGQSGPKPSETPTANWVG
jgi:hypothetical protein